MLNRVGETRHHCQTQAGVWNKPPILSLKRTVSVALSQCCFFSFCVCVVVVCLLLFYLDKVCNDIVFLPGCQQEFTKCFTTYVLYYLCSTFLHSAVKHPIRQQSCGPSMESCH